MLDHEIAHQLDSLLSLSDLSEIQALFESFVITKNGISDYSAITNGLSEYVRKKMTEEEFKIEMAKLGWNSEEVRAIIEIFNNEKMKLPSLTIDFFICRKVEDRNYYFDDNGHLIDG